MARPREVDLAGARQALDAQWALLRKWIGELPRETYAVPSALDGWTVGDLLAHLVRGLDPIAGLEPGEGVQPASIASYVSGYGPAADLIREGTRALAASLDDPVAGLDASWAARRPILDELSPGQVVKATRGPIRAGDLAATRVLEFVVHSDDLARSLPDREPPGLDGDALALVVRLLLGILVERSPGRSVEVRVPPYAVVQCVDGPRHTRGTPPNVVEADALTWVRVAAGRQPWRDAVAVGAVRASGERSDLAALMPLV
jgi:uncharacterized protein (TIGR03083 family)